MAGCLARAVSAAGSSGAKVKVRPGPLCVPVAALLSSANLPSDDSAGESSADESADSATGANTQQPTHAAPVNHDVCVTAHVYQVVELSDGTRFLDVCPAAVSDADCRFLLISMPADREEVGDLRRLVGADIQLRGMLRQMHGRLGIYLSHTRQLHGGPEKFRPNPRLLQDFDASSDRLAVRDPNLRSSGRHRSFMNHALKEPVPGEPLHTP